MRVGTSRREDAPMVRNRAAAAATMHIHKDALVKEMSRLPMCRGTIGLTSNCSIGLATGTLVLLPQPPGRSWLSFISRAVRITLRIPAATPSRNITISRRGEVPKTRSSAQPIPPPTITAARSSVTSRKAAPNCDWGPSSRRTSLCRAPFAGVLPNPPGAVHRDRLRPCTPAPFQRLSSEANRKNRSKRRADLRGGSDSCQA